MKRKGKVDRMELTITRTVNIEEKVIAKNVLKGVDKNIDTAIHRYILSLDDKEFYLIGKDEINEIKIAVKKIIGEQTLNELENEQTFYFLDEITGEEFFVQCVGKRKAKEIANKYFEDPTYLGIVSDYTAEQMGLDTY